ncbi:hypothetical protein [Prevotella amnii]|uniref:hypothetical protein n=1 Tax=Prevotella amnii TaxID=419005 RepID=UPI0012E3D025|nr:hypothetical protein [Prevotella amnii]
MPSLHHDAERSTHSKSLAGNAHGVAGVGRAPSSPPEQGLFRGRKVRDRRSNQ